MDPIRKLFAKSAGVSPSLFSFNSAGACPTCSGLGVLYADLAYLDGVRSTCGDCAGRRFTDEVLGLLVDGKSISDVLDMTAAQASAFFSGRDIRRRLAAVVDVGLGYLTLGQPLSTLSGGECQRLKLAGRLHEEGNLYVLDEPTTGLHMSDCGQLLELLDRLVDGGSSVIVVEHNLDVVAHVDWVIDLGPEGGDAGGMVVFEGPPAELVSASGSLTGEYLAWYAAAVAAGSARCCGRSSTPSPPLSRGGDGCLAAFAEPAVHQVPGCGRGPRRLLPASGRSGSAPTTFVEGTLIHSRWTGRSRCAVTRSPQPRRPATTTRWCVCGVSGCSSTRPCGGGPGSAARGRSPRSPRWGRAHRHRRDRRRARWP